MNIRPVATDREATSQVDDTLDPSTVNDAPRPRFETRWVAAIVAVEIAVLALTTNQYGLNAGDLHQLAQGRRLSWGYIDEVPLIPLLYRISSIIFGTSPTSLHLFANLAGLGCVVVGAMIARELGGRRWAQVVTALLAAIGPLFIGLASFLQPQSIDIFLVALATLIVLRMLRTGDEHLWVTLGLVLGVAMVTKLIIVVWIAATFAGLLLIRRGAIFRSRWFVAGMALTVAIPLPTLIWLLEHRAQFSTFVSSQQPGWERLPLFVFVPFIAATPFGAILWARAVSAWRPSTREVSGFLAPAFVIACSLYYLGGANPAYSVSLLVPLIALGAVLFQDSPRRGLRPVVAVGALVTGGALLPFVLAILPADVTLSSGIGAVFNLNYFIGYRTVADDIARAYHDLPPDERRRTTIFTYTSNEAAVLEFWRHDLHVPQPINAEDNYGIWGFGHTSDTAPVLVVGYKLDEARTLFVGCRQVGKLDSGGQPMDPNEAGRLILLCDRPARPWAEMWPHIVRYVRM